MQLVVISKETFFDGEAELVNQLFEQGLRYFHLRKPGASEEEIISFIEKIELRNLTLVSLHNYHKITGNYPFKRIHLTENCRLNLEREELNGLLNEYSVSTSVHHVSQLASLNPQYAYAFLSPVFDSISKKNYAGFSNGKFRLSDNAKSTKVIALGGIKPNNISKAKAMNFDGVAALGSIWNEPSRAIINFKKLQEQCL